jgi:5'-deoxynucleotidase YfbR-like HD superfamily hydrolase
MATITETAERYFLREAPQDLVSAHDEKMTYTPRWEVNGKQQSKKLETNLDHLEGEHVIADTIFDDFPMLTKGISRIIVHQEIHLHDTPEIITGDDAVGNKDHKAMRQRRWEMERIAFALLTSSENVPNPILRQKLRGLYKRYNNCRPERWKTFEQLEKERIVAGKPASRKWETLTQKEIDEAINDREALLAHFIDKIQASRFGIEYVFRNDEDCTRSVDNILEYAIPLFKATPKEGQEECIQLVMQELKRFKIHGREAARKGQTNFLAAISNAI